MSQQLDQATRAAQRKIRRGTKRIPDPELRAAVACFMAMTEVLRDPSVEAVPVARIAELTGLSKETIDRVGKRFAHLGLIGIRNLTGVAE